MSLRNRSRALALALSIVPGWGHIYWGRERVGLGTFTVFTVAFFALLNGLFLYVGPGQWLLVRASLVALAGTVVGTWVDIYRRTSPQRLRGEKERRDRWIREGMIEYLRGDHEAARTSFLACVRSDPLDVDALFGLGMACSRAGEPRAAAACLRRARRYDDAGKWSWEIREALRGIREGAPRQGASEAADGDPKKTDPRRGDPTRGDPRKGGPSKGQPAEPGPITAGKKTG